MKLRKTKRIIKLIFPKKSFFIVLIIFAIAITLINYKENQFNNKFQNNQEIQETIEIISIPTENEYGTKFIGKVQTKIYKFNCTVKTKESLKLGDILEVQAEYKETSEYKNSGVQSYKNVLKKDNIYGTIKINKFQIISHKKKIKNTFIILQEKIKIKFKQTFNEITSSYLQALILGDKSSLSQETKENYQEGGISHILAISGMHIGIIILILDHIFEKTINNKKAKYIIMITTLICYAQIINLTSSSLRSIIMAIIHIIAKLIYKKDSFLVSFSFASIIILIINPYNLIDTGYILSFLATLSIVLFYNKISSKISTSSKILNYLVSSIFVSISANILLLPILIITFKKISLSSYIIQILLSPLLYIIEILGLISMILPTKILIIIKMILEPLIFIFDKISSINFLTIYTKVPNHVIFISYYTLIILKLLKPKRKFILKISKIVLVTSLLISILVSVTILFDNNLQIYMIDIGQGDSTLIITPNKTKILIDSGGNEEYNIGKNVLLPYLLNKKVNRLDYLIISHFDTDHCKAILEIIDKIEVKNIILTIPKEENKNLETLKEKISSKTNIIIANKGQKFQFDKQIYIEILWPLKTKTITTNEINNNSIVFKLTYKNFSILFTGDIEERAEKAILQEYQITNKLTSTILKVAHHGSKGSSTEEFIKQVNPQYALIGVGLNNKFDHPGKETIQKLETNNTKIYRTDIHGEIKIKTNGNTIKFKTYVNREAYFDTNIK